MPMDAIHDTQAPRDTDRSLLVMLPGATHKPRDFERYGFVRALRERTLAVDTIAVDAHLGYYLERSVVERLGEDIIAPARARGYRRIWLLGISLGGMGALMYARERTAEVAGVIVLAPFLGVRGTIDEIVRAGGIAQWHPGETAALDDERILLAWLKAYGAVSPALPQIHLGYGTGDRFIAASEVLASRLPSSQVVTVAGGHDWPAWTALWETLLDRDVFACSAHAPRAP